MSQTEEIIRIAENNNLCFGNHKLQEKAKADNFAYLGDLLKVKTYHEMTKLEKNGMFLYESVPGTSVSDFRETADGAEFVVEADEDAQIIVGLAEQTAYEVWVNDENIGTMESNLSGKLNLSVECGAADKVKVSIKKA